MSVTDMGSTILLKEYKIPEGNRPPKVKPVVNLINLRPDEKIRSINLQQTSQRLRV